MKAIDYQVMAQAFASHRDLGRLCDEAIYQADLADRLVAAGLGPVHRETPFTAAFGSFEQTYYTDLIVAGRAIYELKTDTVLTSAHEAQLLNYLLLANANRGKLINMRSASVEARFVNAPVDRAERHNFLVHGDTVDPFNSLVIELVDNWGTGLETALYVRALTHLLGGEEKVIRQLPMTRTGNLLGRQRFHLAAPDTAFVVTSFSSVNSAYTAQIARLLEPSPLPRLIWVNIALHDVTFTTIARGSPFL